MTGGTGKTGGSLMAQLQRAGVPCRAASRHSAVPFDWEHRTTWDPALDGVASVYLVAPGTVTDPYALMLDFIASAMRKGVRRFVFLSMAGLPAGGPAHGQVHQWLKDNSDDWAVLCPSAFMQNFSAGPSLATIREEDRIYSNTGEGRVPFIDANDIAPAALAALTAPAPLMLVSQIDEEFIELGSLLHNLQETAPEDFQALLSQPQLGKRKGYYLIEIDRAFADSGVPGKRLKRLGWTKLQIIARHVAPDNCEELLKLAETHTAKNLEKIMRGQEPILGGRTVLLFFTAYQFAAFSNAILAHGAIPNKDGFIGKEAALIAALGKNEA